MTREERLRLLGADTVAKIRARVAQAPEPSDELVEELRRIFAPTVRRHAVAQARALLATATAEQREVLLQWLRRQDEHSR